MGGGEGERERGRERESPGVSSNKNQNVRHAKGSACVLVTSFKMSQTFSGGWYVFSSCAFESAF